MRDAKKSLGAPGAAGLAEAEAAASLFAEDDGGDDFAAAECAIAGGERSAGIAAGTAAAEETLPSAPSTGDGVAAVAHPRRYWLLRATGY